MCIKLNLPAKTIFFIQVGVYIFTVLPFVIVDLIANFKIETETTATIQISNLKLTLILDCLLLSEDGSTTIQIWLGVDGFPKLVFFLLYLTFACIVGIDTEQSAKKYQNGFSIFASIFFLFQIAWVGYGLYLIKNVVEPNDKFLQILDIDLCNDKIIALLNVLGIGGIVATLINIVISLFRPRVKDQVIQIVESAQDIIH